MGLHINRVQGDYIFYAWVEGENERYKKLISELKSLGYRLKDEDDDYLNVYEYYENDHGDIKVVTECCL